MLHCFGNEVNPCMLFFSGSPRWSSPHWEFVGFMMAEGTSPHHQSFVRAVGLMCSEHWPSIYPLSWTAVRRQCQYMALRGSDGASK